MLLLVLWMLPPGEDFSGPKATSAFLSAVSILCTLVSGVFLLPVLGICASLQGLNIALGAALVGSVGMAINLRIVRSLTLRKVEGIDHLETLVWFGSPGFFLLLVCVLLKLLSYS